MVAIADKDGELVGAAGWRTGEYESATVGFASAPTSAARASNWKLSASSSASASPNSAAPDLGSRQPAQQGTAGPSARRDDRGGTVRETCTARGMAGLRGPLNPARGVYGGQP